jgi:hypothetical protein
VFAANRGDQWGEVVSQSNAEAYVAPYVQVQHAIHLLYATSPRSRDGHQAGRAQGAGSIAANHRYDKDGNRLPLELHGCGCSLCARRQRALQQFWAR